MKIETVYIYNDYGASQLCVKELFNCFKSTFSHLRIESITGKDILAGKLFETEPKSILLCFGGGFDLGYLKSLESQKGCNEIKNFVQQGGNYLGICAGAYFASNSIAFDLDGPLEVKGERYLKFSDGEACGPINKLFVYSSDPNEAHLNALSARICLVETQKEYFTYLNGGCYFNGMNLINVESLAEYVAFNPSDNILEAKDNKIAVFNCNIGLGKCLLSGVHFEFDVNNMVNLNQNIRDDLLANVQPNATHSNYELINYFLNKSFNFK